MPPPPGREDSRARAQTISAVVGLGIHRYSTVPYSWLSVNGPIIVEFVLDAHYATLDLSVAAVKSTNAQYTPPSADGTKLFCRVGGVNTPVGSRDPVHNFLG